MRNVAAENRVNPLTVLKGYQQLVDEQLVEKRRGLGMFVNAGARDLLLQAERQRFLTEQWPRDPRHHPAARPDAEELLGGASDAADRREGLSRWPCIEARGLRKAYRQHRRPRRRRPDASRRAASSA